MFWRIKKGLNLTISEADPKTTLFDMLKHKHWGEKDNKPNPNRKKLVFTWRTWKTHGLNDLNYTKLETHHCSLFTRFLVDTHPPSFVGKRLSKTKGQQKSGQQKAWSRKIVYQHDWLNQGVGEARTNDFKRTSLKICELFGDFKFKV